jgi:hypothetical protein
VHEGRQVVGLGRRRDHLGLIDVLAEHEELGVRDVRGDPPLAQVGCKVHQAQAEAHFQIGQEIGPGGAQQGVDRRRAIVVRVEGVLVGRAQQLGQLFGRRARAGLGDPKRRHLAAAVETLQDGDRPGTFLGRRVAGGQSQLRRQGIFQGPRQGRRRDQQ